MVIEGVISFIFLAGQILVIPFLMGLIAEGIGKDDERLFAGIHLGWP